MAVDLQPHDWRFLTALSQVGLLTTEDAYHRFYRTGKKCDLRSCQRRLRALRMAGYIESETVTLNTGCGPRKLPSVHRATRLCAEAVEQHTGQQTFRLANGKPLAPFTLLHRIAVVRTILWLGDACRESNVDDPRFLLEQDTIPQHERTDDGPQKFVLCESFGRGEARITVRPDAALRLVLPGRENSKRWVLCAYLEVDRSTEGSRFARKLPGYELLLRPPEHRYRRHFQDADFARVLVVCKSRERIENLCKTTLDLPGSGNFRFALESELAGSCLRDPIWRDVHGRRLAILSTESREEAGSEELTRTAGDVSGIESSLPSRASMEAVLRQ